MDYIDARRLTGPNLLMNEPGSILDITCAPEQVSEVVATWEATIKPMLSALGWHDKHITSSPLTGGVSLAFTAPIDVLYAASEVNEWAWKVMEAHFQGKIPPKFEQAFLDISAEREEEKNPSLLALAEQARKENVSLLWDDDEVSVGLGRGSQTWPFRELPKPQTLSWPNFHDIPVGIVTGTNGKTTTVRLATRIVQETNKNVGVSCTDWIAVNSEIIERGDWSGPGGARNVLRQKNVDIAVLECARGGMLRRGLGVEKAEVALITNIAEDHLGDFGSRNLNELLNIKWVVSHPVRNEGYLVLNADDPLLVNKAKNYEGQLVWFSLDDDNPVVEDHLKQGGLAFVLANEQLLHCQGTERSPICASDEIPITLGGAARHNIANSLAAAALTYCLGTTIEDIRAGLKGVQQEDNPGRCNLYDVSGVSVLVDFAHNPHAMQALFDMAAALPAKRRLLAFGQAGDRPDSLIQELAREAWSIGLDRILVSELEDYHRGRNHGEVYQLISEELLKQGAQADQIRHFEKEIEALEAALSWARPGDLIIMLALAEGVAIQEHLDKLTS